jgi:CBS domain-containing protein
MLVKDGMSEVVVTVGPGHSLREAARLMAERKVGAAVVMDPDSPTPGIVTERDILESIGSGQDPEREQVQDHLTGELIVASPEWSLEQAAETMVENNFRHLIVINGGELLGILSMRDIVRCWTRNGAFSQSAG